MGRRRKPPASVARVRVCIRCGNVKTFSHSHPLQKVCDECRADPRSKARHATDAQVRWARAKRLAVRRLIDLHPDEYDRIFAEERALLQCDGWTGATLREIDDFERRREEAAVAGWRTVE